ncbi:uncharacterized protein BDW47DRAFT_89271 [Aspergillus candidus]|uniref:Uncharacterized protein n=1 Tax=Aspergillus candidus TaxID=41067 RepID=A0A2I2FIY8_ASPCN|nr:hypothetical protein BDW47DRAFT_89271 [Aspergillus candidus]PLB40596.1 hypothetical protein BDW47DRAFT_89271 [Aspergillus candidus]
MSRYLLFPSPKHASVRQKSLCQPHDFCAGRCTGQILVQVHTPPASLVPLLWHAVFQLVLVSHLFLWLEHEMHHVLLSQHRCVGWHVIRCKSHPYRPRSLG